MNVPPKDGRTTDVYFEKKHPWLSEVRCKHGWKLLVTSSLLSSTFQSLWQLLLQGDKYVDKLRYKDTQPVKNKGFLSGRPLKLSLCYQNTL